LFAQSFFLFWRNGICTYSASFLRTQAPEREREAGGPFAPAWNKSERPVPPPAMLKLAPPLASAKPAMVVRGEKM